MKSQKDLIKAYVTPYIWQGYCWIDGGLGTLEAGEGLGWKVVDGKREMDLKGVKRPTSNPMSRWTSDPTKYRVFLTPDSEYYIGSDDCSDISGANPRYVCCFAGPDLNQLRKMVEEIAEICESQVWVLDAYVPDGSGVNQERYRLWIRQGKIGDQNFEKPVFKILAGTMVPDFSKSTDIAGW